METITVDEMRTLIKEEKIKPSKLFGIDDLAEDPIVKGIAKEAIQAELTHRKRLSSRFEEVDEDREKEKTEWEKEKTEKEEEIKKLKIEGAKRDATELFSSKIKERKIDKQQEAFLKSKQGDFTPEDPENLDKEVDKFLDKNVEEYKATAKIFGHKTEEKKDEPKGGGEPGEGGSKEDDELIPD